MPGNFFRGKKGWGIVFFLCISYWSYLWCTTTPAVQFDAADYVSIAKIIHDRGWDEFFRTGPHREPLYPLLISWAMDVSGMFGVSYTWILKIFQVALLLATQIGMVLLLRRMGVRRWIQYVVVLYAGFSPAIVNSTFSLFAEIITYPFVVGVVWLGFLSWRALWQGSVMRRISLSAVTALCFVLAAFGKGIFQYVFLFYLGTFFVLALGVDLKNKMRRAFPHAMLYAVTAFIVFNACIVPFKIANKIGNGQFTFTNRFSDLLFGNAVKRTNSLAPRMMLAHVASVPGAGACRVFFTDQECSYCEFQMADFFRGMELLELKRDFPREQWETRTIGWALDKIRLRPFQYLFLSFIETWRMAFWETTQLGHVGYPPVLQKIFDFVLFKNTVRLIMSVLTYASLFFLCVFVWRRRSYVVSPPAPEAERVQFIFWLLFVVGVYTVLHAPFSIVTRYAQPMASLYLMGIALWLDEIGKNMRIGR